MRNSVWGAASVQAQEGPGCSQDTALRGRGVPSSLGVFKLLSGTHGDRSAVEEGGTQGPDSEPQPETSSWLSKGAFTGQAFKGRSQQIEKLEDSGQPFSEQLTGDGRWAGQGTATCRRPTLPAGKAGV